MKFDYSASEKVIEGLRSSFLESADQKIHELNAIIDALWNDRSSSAETMNRFLGEVHSLKGMGGTFGYPQTTIICHHLETFLEGVTSPSDGHLDAMQKFVDSLRASVEIWPTPDDDVVKQIVESLPQPQDAPAPSTEDLSIGTVLLVSPNPSVRQLAEFFLNDFGLDVTVCETPIEAFGLAVRNKPLLVVTAVEMEELTGIELIAALKTTRALKNAHFAILSASSDAGIVAPEKVAVIAIHNMEAEIERTLDDFGF